MSSRSSNAITHLVLDALRSPVARWRWWQR